MDLLFIDVPSVSEKLTERDIRAEHAWTNRKVTSFTKSAEESLVPSDNPRPEDPFRLRTHERYPSSRATLCNGGGIKIVSSGCEELSFLATF